MDHMPLEAVQAWPAKAADALGLEGQTTLSDPPCGGKRIDGSRPQPENNAERKSIALLGDLYELFALMSNSPLPPLLGRTDHRGLLAWHGGTPIGVLGVLIQ
jgi:hypothetical protein